MAIPPQNSKPTSTPSHETVFTDGAQTKRRSNDSGDDIEQRCINAVARILARGIIRHNRSDLGIDVEADIENRSSSDLSAIPSKAALTSWQNHGSI